MIKKPELNVAAFDSVDFSGIDQYLGCGEQFRRVRILQQPTVPSFAMDEGSGHHKALATNNLSKRDKGKTLKSAKMQEVFVQTVEGFLKKPEIKKLSKTQKLMYFNGESLDEATKRAKTFYDEYLRRIDPEIDPDWVEQPFIKPVTVEEVEFQLTGVVDLTTKKKKLRDYKTSSSLKSQAEADNSLQLTLYSATTGLADVGFIDFVKTKNPYVAEIKSRRSPAQHAWGLKIAKSVIDGIRKGSFPLASPDPRNWRCSEKFCGFWGTCRGKYELASSMKLKETK